MYKAIWLQAAGVLVVVGVAAAISGLQAGVSALLGGMAYALPSAWFAVRLARLAARPDAQSASSYPTAFFIGEVIKVASAIGLLALIPALFPGLHWPWMLAGLVVALQAGFFAFLTKN